MLPYEFNGEMNQECNLNTFQTVYADRSESVHISVFNHSYLHQERCPAITSGFADFLIESGKIDLSLG